MHRHYGKHDYWNYEHVERVKPDRQVVEAEAEDYVCKICANHRRIVCQCLSDVDRQLSADVEDEIIPSVRLDYGYYTENYPGDPEHLVSELVSTSKVLVEHVHYGKQYHGVGSLIVNVPNQKSPVHLIVD